MLQLYTRIDYHLILIISWPVALNMMSWAIPYLLIVFLLVQCSSQVYLWYLFSKHFFIMISTINVHLHQIFWILVLIWFQSSKHKISIFFINTKSSIAWMANELQKPWNLIQNKAWRLRSWSRKNLTKHNVILFFPS